MSKRDTTRRRFLGTAAAITAAGLAGCSGGSGGGDGGSGDTDGSDSNGGSDNTEGSDSDGSTDSGSMPSFDGYLEETSNYDGVVDETGSSEVAVKVGTEANGGYFGFGPAAVRVSTGTTVVWEWTGQGSLHNVVAEDGSFESEQTDEEGFTFSHTFEEAGTTKYYCTPHETLGMKGVVVAEE
ncbi:halocyanin domain-containing protein [Halobellus ordinarius]|uniref:halocyanin domain-containing protein n=1 Tax=Halobellus ordinarius TaxID=3075120 RepID=UPI0028800E81|nr:halocyanin domain-containing protein [Halobellus sp. ZY16]